MKGFPKSAASGNDPNNDLGFGRVVAAESRQRLLNRDGTFNVSRRGMGAFESQSLYHLVLEVSWPTFLALAAVYYLTLNLVFAGLYTALGPGAISGGVSTTLLGRYWEAFSFSVHTTSTVGYGNLLPNGWGANALVVAEAIAGLLSFGLVSGLMFARFSRPTVRILFSEPAVITSFGDGRAFMFRIINQRQSQLSDMEARVIFTSRMEAGGRRSFVELKLDRERVAFFPLAWTIVHPIDEASPLKDLTQQELIDCDGEFLVLLKGYDDAFSQTVQVRSSYRAEEVVVGARFIDMFDHEATDGELSVDVSKLHGFQRD